MFTSAFVTTGSHPSHSWPLRKRANVPPGWRLGASSCSRNELSDRWCLPCAGWSWNISGIWKGNPGKPNPKWPFFAHRIHGAAIYGNIYHQYTPNVSIYTIHGSYGLGKINENHGTYLRSTVCLRENRLSGNDFWPHYKKRVVKPNMKEQVGQRADGVQVIIRKCKELGSTSTVLKSHQAGKVTSSPWHGGDTEKSHQVVESHIREEESPWHSLFHPYLEM